MNVETPTELLTTENPQIEQIGLVWRRMLEERLNSWEFHKILFPKIKKQLTEWRKSLQDKFGETCLLSLLLVFDRTRATTFPTIADSTLTKDLAGAKRLGNILGVIPVMPEQEPSLEQMIKTWQGLPRRILLPSLVVDHSLADFIEAPRRKDPSLGSLIRHYLEQERRPQEIFTTMAEGLQDCLCKQLAPAENP